MDYTQLFRSLREARDLGLEELAEKAGVHRNTVVNIESGRPVKFKTVAALMQTMGYAAGSAEMRSMALLWLEAVSGIPFSRPDAEASARKAISGFRSPARQAARELENAVVRANLTPEQIQLLIFAVREPEVLAAIERIQAFSRDLAARSPSAERLRLAAEDAGDYDSV